MTPSYTGGGEATKVLTWEQTAASAYQAYAAVTDNKNFRGEPMPAFQDLPETIRSAWEAALRQADHLREAARLGFTPLPIERWRGYTSIHTVRIEEGPDLRSPDPEA